MKAQEKDGPENPSETMSGPTEEAFGALRNGLITPDAADARTLLLTHAKFIGQFLLTREEAEDHPIFTAVALGDHARDPKPTSRQFVRTVGNTRYLFEQMEITMDWSNAPMVHDKSGDVRLMDIWGRLRQEGKYLMIMQAPPPETAGIPKTLPDTSVLFQETRPADAQRAELSAHLAKFRKLPRLIRDSILASLPKKDEQEYRQYIDPAPPGKPKKGRPARLSDAKIHRMAGFFTRLFESEHKTPDGITIYGSIIPAEIVQLYDLPQVERRNILERMAETWRVSLTARYNLNAKKNSIPFTRRIHEAAALTTYDMAIFRQYTTAGIVYLKRYFEQLREFPGGPEIPEAIGKFLKLPEDDQFALLYRLGPTNRSLIIEQFTLNGTLLKKLIQIDPELTTRTGSLPERRVRHESHLAIRALARSYASREQHADGSTKWYAGMFARNVLQFLGLPDHIRNMAYAEIDPEQVKIFQATYNLDGYYGHIPFPVRLPDVAHRFRTTEASVEHELARVRGRMSWITNKYQRGKIK